MKENILKILSEIQLRSEFKGAVCEYEKVGETLDRMLELDRVLDENFKNQCLIINKLKYVPVI